MAPRALTSTTNSNIHTVYSLSILSEYIHLLDSFPLELSRKFADLRELDAVISSHMNSITNKINVLTQMIEESTLNGASSTSTNNTPSKQDRLLLLSEIAEEAGRLKLGGEDKIRIACSAADILKGHFGHMRALLEHLPGFDMSVLRRRTTYPHISPRSYMPPGGLETGRRRRGGYGSLLTGSVESPAKRKRANRDDDVEERANGRSPNKKERNGDHSQRNRNASRAKKNERGASPTDSVLSVTSYMPANTSQYQLNNGNATTTSFRAVNTTSGSKRSRPNHNHNSNATNGASASTSTFHVDPMYNRIGNTNTSNGSRRDVLAAPQSSSSSHPSLMYGPAAITMSAYDRASGPAGTASTGVAEWPAPTQLEGPGMPVARKLYPPPPPPPPPLWVAEEVVDQAAGDVEGEVEGDEELDNKRYCICDTVSYGEMIACDDSSCEKEWFHLGCLNLATSPSGKWYCDACKAKKNAKKSGRGGKRKANNSRRERAVANGS